MQKPSTHLLRSFRAKARHRKTAFKRFLTRLEKKPIRGLQQLIAKEEKEVWAQVDCLSCANCCKTMTPTYTPADLKRIARHFGMTVEGVKKKWLKQERGGDRDWVNRSTPCQFLDTKSNKCSIYAIRPLRAYPQAKSRQLSCYFFTGRETIKTAGRSHLIVYLRSACLIPSAQVFDQFDQWHLSLFPGNGDNIVLDPFSTGQLQ